KDKRVKMIGVEAAGRGIGSGHHAATLVAGSVGILHGSKSYLLQDKNGQVKPTDSISAGLDYPGVGPEHSYLKDSKRVQYLAVTDREAMEGFQLLAEEEGIIPALESAHAVAYALKLARRLSSSKTIVACLSGRGDKDLDTVISRLKKSY
ncbi:MAG: pyridoxal-phosphate dependent enzyme, partial [Deltaproteobacteria bacterium]|nr:pyridoxal-phosphate dependent enzyme [Deltaproteobacteria bacterium]